MLIFCHLFIGSVLGLFLYRAFGKRWMVPVAAVGAILPDLVDKPLGHIILYNSLDSGRIFGHSLLFLGIIILIGLAVWKMKGTPVGLVVASGMVTHLILDSMWENPTTLFFPLLGPFTKEYYPEYFSNSFVTELTSPTEWVFGLALVWIYLSLYKDDIFRSFDPLRRQLDPLAQPLLGAMIMLGAGYLILGALSLVDDPAAGSATAVLGVAAMIGGSVMLYKERKDPLI